MLITRLLVILIILFGVSKCHEGTEADVRGVGSGCITADDCTEEGQDCLDFKGGYCGIKDCTADTECPEGSRCVAHTDGTNYCFLICTEKPQCNLNRSLENESNCSANITFVEDPQEAKACVPPSGD
jgi:hypothetical protein